MYICIKVDVGCNETTPKISFDRCYEDFTILTTNVVNFEPTSPPDNIRTLTDQTINDTYGISDLLRVGDDCDIERFYFYDALRSTKR